MKNTIKRRLMALAMATMILLPNFIFPQKVQAGEVMLHEDFYDFLQDFTVQSNTQSIFKKVYDSYVQTGVTVEEAMEMATKTVKDSVIMTGTNFKDTIKNTFQNISNVYKNLLVSIYDEVKDKETGRYEKIEVGVQGDRPNSNKFTIKVDENAYKAIKEFNKDFYENTTVQTAYEGAVRVMYIQEFKEIVLRPLIENIFSYWEDVANKLMVGIVNGRYVSIHKTLRRISSGSEPLGYYNQKCWYFHYDPNGFIKPSENLLNSTEVQSDLKIAIHGYILVDVKQNGTTANGIGTNYDNSRNINGKYTGSEYYYILYDEPETPYTPIQNIINNHYTGEGQTINNEYIQFTNDYDKYFDEEFLTELKDIIQGKEPSNITYITINNYYGSDASPTPQPTEPSQPIDSWYNGITAYFKWAMDFALNITTFKITEFFSAVYGLLPKEFSDMISFMFITLAGATAYRLLRGK